MLNWIWLALILVAVLWGAFTGTMEAVSLAVFEQAKAAVQLVIGLVGGMMLFLGLMQQLYHRLIHAGCGFVWIKRFLTEIQSRPIGRAAQLFMSAAALFLTSICSCREAKAMLLRHAWERLLASH